MLNQRAIGRRQQRRARVRGRDQAAEERLVEAVRVLQRIDDREARLRAEQQRRVAVGDVQIREERLRRRHLRQRGRHVHGRRGRADAALGADEREDLPARRRRGAMRDETRDRLLERGLVIGSCRNSFAPARMASIRIADRTRRRQRGSPRPGAGA